MIICAMRRKFVGFDPAEHIEVLVVFLGDDIGKTSIVSESHGGISGCCGGGE